MHFGNHMRRAFGDWVDEGMPPLASVEQNYEPVVRPAEKLLGRMCHCSDVIPGTLCDELDLERGSTYARAAQRLLSERKAASGALDARRA